MLDIWKYKAEEFNKKYHAEITPESLRDAYDEIKAKTTDVNEGARYLAETLGEPFYTEPDYVGIVRSVLNARTLDPAEQYKFWKKQKYVTAYVISDTGEPRRIKGAVTSYSPTYFPVSTPQVEIPLMDLLTTGLDLVMDAKKQIAEAMDKFEDTKLFALLDAAATTAGHVNNSVAVGKYDYADFKAQVKELRDHTTPDTLIMHPDRVYDIPDWGLNVTNGAWTQDTREQFMKTGTWNVPILGVKRIVTSELCDINNVYLVASSDNIGWFFTIPVNGKRRTTIVKFGFEEASGTASTQPIYLVSGYEIVGMTIKMAESVSKIEIKTS